MSLTTTLLEHAKVSCSGPRVLNNDVIDTVKQSVGVAYGIFFTLVTGGLAVNNRITGADHGIEYEISTGKYRDNLTFDVPTSPDMRFIGGKDVGNNN